MATFVRYPEDFAHQSVCMCEALGHGGDPRRRCATGCPQNDWRGGTQLIRTEAFDGSHGLPKIAGRVEHTTID